MKSKTRPMIMQYKELSTYERLAIYMKEPEGRKTVRLGPKEEELLLILKTTFGYLMASKSTQTIIDLLQEKFNCSTSTAYRYIADAKNFFFDVEEMERKAERYLALKQCEEGMKRALEAKDEEAYYNYLKLKCHISGFDEPDAFMPDFESLQPPTIIVGFMPEELKTPLPEKSVLDAEIKKFLEPKRKVNLPIEDAKLADEDGAEEDSL